MSPMAFPWIIASSTTTSIFTVLSKEEKSRICGTTPRFRSAWWVIPRSCLKNLAPDMRAALSMGWLLKRSGRKNKWPLKAWSGNTPERFLRKVWHTSKNPEIEHESLKFPLNLFPEKQGSKMHLAWIQSKKSFISPTVNFTSPQFP